MGRFEELRYTLTHKSPSTDEFGLDSGYVLVFIIAVMTPTLFMMWPILFLCSLIVLAVFCGRFHRRPPYVGGVLKDRALRELRLSYGRRYPADQTQI